VTRHLLCLTVDTDPDGLSGVVTNRQTLVWKGLENLRHLPKTLGAIPRLAEIPVTWFVRADGQLESILGTPAYLLETYAGFWSELRGLGHEIGWHPHLYLQRHSRDVATLITGPQQALVVLERLWAQLMRYFQVTAFRHGEGWHTSGTYATVERFGFRCDSTAIPGRRGRKGHPMNWEGAPNQPYYPDSEDVCRSGHPRPMLELPMNTWLLQGPDETKPRLRYMNPAVHPYLFREALKTWEQTCKTFSDEFCVWVMIFHPDEVLPNQAADALYSRSAEDLCTNLVSMLESLERLGHEFRWTTVSVAADLWRVHQQCLIA